MSDLEASLRGVLESHPEDWSTRFLLAEKLVERGAGDEAAQVVIESPVAPGSEEDLHRVAELAGLGAIPYVEAFVSHNPTSAYAHQLLGDLLVHQGDTERAEKHHSASAKLSGAEATSEAPSEGHEAVPPPPPLQEEGVPNPDVAEEEGDLVLTENDGPPPQAGKKATAIVLAIVVHVVIALIAMLVVILPANRDEPEIVAAVIAPPSQKQEMQKKNVVKQTKKTTASAAAAAPMAQLMRANAMAKLSLPNVTRTSKGPLGLGDADLGSGGFGSGTGGLGSGASFFGGTSTGKRFLFVIDHSKSMSNTQVRLRNDELEKALKSLEGVEYQVILFAGGGYYGFPGWSVEKKGKDNVVRGEGEAYRFRQRDGAGDYDFDGADSRLPKTEWLASNPSNVSKTMKFIKGEELFIGTDWGVALDIAHRMEPAPDVIFFMADGTGGNAPSPILATNRKFGRPVINTVAMQTKSGMKEFAELARETKGSYTIVDKRGKAIDGFEYMKSPEKFKGRL
ncbi:MAG: hypothetical protein AAGA96_05925 [Verrucomicrobiota bacterium]